MEKRYIGILSLSGLLLCCILSFSSTAQTTFEKHYLKGYDQSGKDVLELSDGYLIAGTTENSTTDDLNILISKTDLDGNMLWQKEYGGPRPEYPNSMIATSDGNFFVVGYTQSTGTDWDLDMYLLKIKPNGDTIFSKTYGGTGNEELKEIIETADGKYVMVGATNSNSSGNATSDNQIQLIKINLSGSVIWSQYYGDSDYQSARSVALCSDDGFIIAGKTAPSPTANATALIIKTDSNGDPLWTKFYTGPNSYEGKSIVPKSDGYVLAMDDSSATFDSDIRIIKLSTDGNTIMWNKFFGGNDKDIVKVIEPTNDGGFIVGAISRSFWGANNPDMWILKLTSSGSKTWDEHFGGSGHEHCYSVHQTSDDGYIAVGHARSFSSKWEIYLIKLDQNGTVGIEALASNDKFSIYPNPSNGKLNIDMSENKFFNNLSISNSLGQMIFTEDLQSLRGNEIMTVDLKNNTPGIYFITLRSASTSITKKLILN